MRSDARYSADLIDTEDFGRQKIEVKARFAELFRDQPYQDDGGSLMFERESNGMPTLDTAPRDSPAWQRRIEKARREIQTHQREIRIRVAADAITLEDIQKDIQEIRTWAKSLSKAKSPSGSIVSTRREAN